METDFKKLFEAVPTADVTDQAIELAKVKKNKSTTEVHQSTILLIDMIKLIV